MKGSPFASLSDDVVLKILSKLEEDPRHWARLACASARFSSLIRSFCWPARCRTTVPAVAADLSLPSPSSDHSPAGWSSLHKISVCCPGLLHAGVLLDNSDFGLERELGPDEIYIPHQNQHNDSSAASAASADPNLVDSSSNQNEIRSDCDGLAVDSGSSDLQWSLYDDLYFDTVYDKSESHDYNNPPPNCDAADVDAEAEDTRNEAPAEECRNLTSSDEDGRLESPSKKRKLWRSKRSHLASGGWGLSREQGNKLLASRFREDSLYISDWPGCIHMEEKRNYMLFRGIFKNFKRSRVWRTINDGQRSKIDLNCAYCSCKETWDLHSAFCLRRVFGYHDDGEPVVRAYVCENGHVSGAWTDLPLYV